MLPEETAPVITNATPNESERSGCGDIGDIKTKKRSPKLYWTLDRCAVAASSCLTKKEFETKFHAAYKRARIDGFLNQICQHMIAPDRRGKCADKERAREFAKKCRTRGEFRQKYGDFFTFCYKMGWLDDVCSHMAPYRLCDDEYSKELCRKAALEHSTLKGFRKEYRTYYTFILKMGWKDELCGHLKHIKVKNPRKTELAVIKAQFGNPNKIKYPRGYWTKERCHDCSLQCRSRSEFAYRFSQAYHHASKNKWLSEITKHLYTHKSLSYEECREIALRYNSRKLFIKEQEAAYNRILNKKWDKKLLGHLPNIGSYVKRMVYTYTFSDKSIYVGLTDDEMGRINEHLVQSESREKSPVYQYRIKTGLTPVYRKFCDYIDAEKAQEIEIALIKTFRENGYNVLNKRKGGELGGGPIKWTIEAIIEESKKYSILSSFLKTASGAANAAMKYGIYQEVTAHMTRKIHSKRRWTRNKCAQAAASCLTMKDFKSKYGGAVTASERGNWLSEITNHFINT